MWTSVKLRLISLETDITDVNHELNDGDERIDKTANEVVTA